MRTNTSTTRIQVFLHQNTVFHQLLQPILRQDFERLAKQHHQGQKLRSATRWDQFIAILMSQLSCRQSLRDIESNLESQQEKLYHLKLKSFLGRSRNAIQTQIWIALIAYLLVSFAKHMAQEGGSVQRLLRIIQVNLFERKPLKALFLPDKKWDKQEEPQLRFFL